MISKHGSEIGSGKDSRNNDGHDVGEITEITNKELKNMYVE